MKKFAIKFYRLERGQLIEHSIHRLEATEFSIAQWEANNWISNHVVGAGIVTYEIIREM